MMMPARFSVVAENEMTYVSGGALDPAKMASTFGKNLWTIIGNTYISKLVSATLGTMFGGNYLVGGFSNGVLSALATTITGDGTYNFLNGAMQVIGLGAAVSQMATTDAAPIVDGADLVTITGAHFE